MTELSPNLRSKARFVLFRSDTQAIAELTALSQTMTLNDYSDLCGELFKEYHRIVNREYCSATVKFELAKYRTRRAFPKILNNNIYNNINKAVKQ